MSEFQLSVGRYAELACLLEVTAAKPGNVHRGADFENTTFDQFVVSAVAFGQVIDALDRVSVGQTILQAVKSTRHHVGTNTNLGMILLLVPLAKATHHGELGRETVSQVTSQLTAADARNVYEAIRLAQPGGMGTVARMDLGDGSDPPSDLRVAMELAKERDLIARQYVNGFIQVFDVALPLLLNARTRFPTVTQAIVCAHVSFMAQFPDSLIARKTDKETANHGKMLATKAVEALGDSDSEDAFWAAVGELDFWLRSDGHRRNPGTTADLITAALFVALHSGKIQPPFK